MLRQIKNDMQYENILVQVFELMQLDLQHDNKGIEELEILSRMIKEYEEEHWPVPNPTFRKLLD